MLFHDLHLSLISRHSVWSELTCHNPLHWSETKREQFFYRTKRRPMSAYSTVIIVYYARRQPDMTWRKPHVKVKLIT